MNSLAKSISKHWQQYLVLLVVLNFGIGIFYLLRFNPYYQNLAILATSFAYILWGLIHHWLEGDLHIKIVIEYFLIALLVDVLIFSILLRS